MPTENPDADYCFLEESPSGRIHYTLSDQFENCGANVIALKALQHRQPELPGNFSV